MIKNWGIKYWIKLVSRTIMTLVNREHPYFCHLYITRRCNLRCRMCNVWRSPTDELNTESMFKIIDRLDKLGVMHIQVTGGEPFLRKDINNIISYIRRKGLSAYASTNGTLPLSVYEKIVESPINGIGVSLHSTNPKIQEKINGVGSWRKTINTIRFLKEKRKNVYVCCVVSSLNLHEVPNIVRFCEDGLGVPISLEPAFVEATDNYFFRGKDESLKNLDYGDIEKTMKHLGILGIRRTRTFMKSAFRVLANKKVGWNCRAGRMFFAIMPDGRFGICQDILTDINILDDNFFDKVRSKEFRNKTNYLIENCSRCVYACYFGITNMFDQPWQSLDIGARLLLFNLSKKLKM